ncbi:AAA family ATPase [Nanoarchaeota archaeon]
MVLTGGPSAGKSSIIEFFTGKDGVYTIEEAAKYVIDREQKKDSDCLPWRNNLVFQLTVLNLMKRWEKVSNFKGDLVVQDRGILDGIAYLRANKLDIPEQYKNLDLKYTKVFILDMLPFKKTKYRKDKHLAKFLDKELEKVYKEHGFEVIRVPVMSIKDRVKFILGRC